MDTNDEIKETDIKNRTFYYFDDIIKSEVFNLDNILLDEKSYKNILVYNVLYKNLIGAKPLRIRFDKIDGFIRVLDGTTTTDKIFEKNSSFHVKYHTTGNVKFLFSRRFLLVFWEEDWALDYNYMKF